MVVEKVVELQNETGLHLRPAMVLANQAALFKSSVSVAKDGQEPWVDAKSIISLLTLGAEKGTRLKIRVEGEDAKQALAALVSLICGGFED